MLAVEEGAVLVLLFQAVLVEMVAVVRVAQKMVR
jgi:hypothetical protein